jgi:crotonobetainyl-CoA:carnitine CoA-transferase CaiB-like acyl-CoA transferase
VSQETRGELPLAGMRVLEIGGGVAAAFATRFLAGYGADVARSEERAGELTGDEEAALLPGKRRISVSDAELRALALAADALVEDGKPGSLAARGLDPRALRAEKPSLVITSLTPFGQHGPYAGYEATNLVAHAAGGIHSLTGLATRPPLANGANQAWKLLGLNGFGATLTAYYGAQLRGEGDWIDLSAQECAAGMLELYGPRSAMDGVPSPRLGNRTNAVWGIYPARDGYAGVCTLQRQVPALFALIGDPELEQPRFLDPMQRIRDDRELGEKVAAWFATRTRTELVELGAKHKVPLGAVMTSLDLLSNASLRERGFFDEVETPAGRARVPGRPFLGLPWRAGALSAPGADTDAVLRDWLGAGRAR